MNNTVGSKEGLGAGIVGLALLMAFLPSASQQISDLDFVSSEPFTILLGAVYVIAVILLLAGIGIIFGNFDDES